MDTGNPWDFKHIHNLRNLQEFDDVGPCVVMASPGVHSQTLHKMMLRNLRISSTIPFLGMLQSGISRKLFEMWCSNKRNGVILCGYTVEGTLAHTILNEPKDSSLTLTRRLQPTPLVNTQLRPTLPEASKP